MVTLTTFSLARLSRTRQPIWLMVWAIKKGTRICMQDRPSLTTLALCISSTSSLVPLATSLKSLVSVHKSKRATHLIVSQKGERQQLVGHASITMHRSLSWTMLRRKQWPMDSISKVGVVRIQMQLTMALKTNFGAASTLSFSHEWLDKI